MPAVWAVNLRRSGPLADSYPAAVALVVLALVPFLLVTASVASLQPVIAKDLGMSKAKFDLTVALSDAAYSFGSVLAVQLAQHWRPRRMLLIYVTIFLAAAVVSAAATSGVVFTVAFVLEGLCTSLMLIAAVPPLVTGWPPRRMPVTAMTMNMCIFGAVALGPTIGSWQASSEHWRPLFWIVVGIGLLALVAALLTYEDTDPADRDAPWDAVAIALAGVGCAAAFFGAGWLEGHHTLDITSLLPLCGGFAVILLLVAHQYRARHPLMPVKRLATTYPVAGVLVVVFGSAAALGLTSLTLTVLKQAGESPGHVAALFVPEFGAAVLTAICFGLIFRTRFVPAFAIGGTAVIAAAGVVTLGLVSQPSDSRVLVAAGLVGIGVGASVSPALFLAGFSLRSSQIQRVFGLLELLRGVAAFLVVPVLAYVVTQIGGSAKAGITDGIRICIALALIGLVLAVATLATGAAGLRTPDIDRWQDGDEPAWDSPPLGAAVRHSPTAPDPESGNDEKLTGSDDLVSSTPLRRDAAPGESRP